MAEPALVARGVAAMAAAVRIPVTVKSRIGIDDQEEWPALRDFVRTVAEAGCQRFIVHARKAWLQGLSPKENRTLPPLRPALVHRPKRDFPTPALPITGRPRSPDDSADQLAHVNGVSRGRGA